MFKGSRSTLLLFVWVFWIGGSLFALHDSYLYLASGGPTKLWDIVMIALSIAYLLGGIALAFRLDILLPRYRRGIINLVTVGFCISVALNLWGMFSVIQDPGQLDPSATKENSLLFMIALGIVSVAFNFLVYKIVINCINVVSHVSSPKQTPRQTAIYWSIVILFFVTLLAAIFWDPATNSLNVL